MEKIIYTRRVAYELRRQGFEILRVEINPNKPEFDCYIFAESEEFNKALSAISRKKKN